MYVVSACSICRVDVMVSLQIRLHRFLDIVGVDARPDNPVTQPFNPHTPSRRPVSRYEQDAAAWEAWVSRYSDRLGREESFDEDRRHAAMAAANPVFILRNWIAQVTKKLHSDHFSFLVFFFSRALALTAPEKRQ